MKILLNIFLVVILFSDYQLSQTNNPLLISSKNKIGQIEVGGPYVGIEVHNSFPMLNRISFYYPVANSIDISKDYWKRDNYRIMSAGIRIDDSVNTILENEIYNVKQTPYYVEFNKNKFGSYTLVKYEFSKDDPAILITYIIRNNSNKKKSYEFYTRLETTLRTSHTYNSIEDGITSYDSKHHAINISYNNREVNSAQLTISNIGEIPTSFTSKKMLNNDLDSYWLKNKSLPNKTIKINKNDIPIAAFTYEKELAPNEELKIEQVVTMLNKNELEDKLPTILTNILKQTQEYKEYILSNSNISNTIKTKDKNIDKTTQWSNAVLSTNSHYIDGELAPMPAQAEYNFYFTHDALLTDLAAVNFDLYRVRKDLDFIITHADSNKIIPHAYYWKDTKYKTEYAGTENWNHFWFTLVSSRYIRHSNDLEYANKIYPFVIKSIDTALKNKGKDNLMWSFRPDWWDIGNNHGPRAYMTLLAIKALREFNYLQSIINISYNDIHYYSNISDTLHKNLIKRLWNEDLNYLTSIFADGTEDKHIYMGSLLASHFDLLNKDMETKLIETANKYLLDEKLGIYTLFPMDFHKLSDYMGFVGDEAGAPYHYANGGIWNHGNAWYSLALTNNNQKDESYKFIKKCMTLDGIINSPNGQPAMYEYRISDKTNKNSYGKIDKPQFLWAGSWYLYSIYNLFGIKENEWNISIDPFIPSDIDEININLTLNRKSVPITISGIGSYINSINVDNKIINSSVIPADLLDSKNINVKLGNIESPYLSKVNAIVTKLNYNKNENILSFALTSFKNHKLNFEILSKSKCIKIFNGKREVKFTNEYISEDNIYKIICIDISEEKSINYTIYINEYNR